MGELLTGPREIRNKMSEKKALQQQKQFMKQARRKQFGKNLISLIREIDKRVENQMWQETVNYVPLVSYLVDLMGVIGNFNSQSSTIQVLEELNEMSNDQSLSHHYILSRFAEITGLMIIVMDAKTTDCTIYGPMKLLLTSLNHPELSSYIKCHLNKWKVLPFDLLRRKYRMGAETEHYIHISIKETQYFKKSMDDKNYGKSHERWSNFIRQVEKFQFIQVKNSHARFNNFEVIHRF